MKKSIFSVVAFGIYSVSACAAQSFTLAPVTVEEKADNTSPMLSHTYSRVLREEQSIESTTISEALKDAFFVQSKKSSDYTSTPYIRGRSITGVPIYLEGMRINAGHDDSTNIFAMTDIAQIDVYRGANGATLGMGAMSGGIVAKFKEPEFGHTDEFQSTSNLNAQTSLFSKTGYATSLGTTIFNDTVNLSLSGGISDYNNYDSGNGDEVLHSAYDASNYNIAAAIKTGEDSYLYGRFMRDDSSSQDPLSRYQQTGTWFYTDRPNDEAKNYFIGFKKAELAGLSDIHLQFFGNDLHYDINTKKEANIPYATELYRDSETNGAKLSAKKAVDNHLFSFATTYSKMEISNGVRQWNGVSKQWNAWTSAFGIKGGDIKTLSFQASDDITYDKLFFTLGAGYENVKRSVTSNVNTTALDNNIPEALDAFIQQKNTDANDNLFSFSAKAGYEISQAFVPYIKVSNAERTPYFNEAYGNNPSNGSQIPNQTLGNEKVWGVDVGMDGKYNQFYYTSALYYQAYTDYIELVKTGYLTTGGLPIKRYVNLDDAVIYGAEVMMGFDLGNSRFVEATYLYTHGQNKDDDTPLAFIAPQKLTLSLAQRRQKGLNWSVEEVFVDNQNRISSVNGELETSGYAITNISVGYGFGTLGWMKKAMLSFELDNVFDKAYREHLDKVSSTAWYLPDSSGVHGILSLRAKF